MKAHCNLDFYFSPITALLSSSGGLARRLPVGIMSVLIEHLSLVFRANGAFQVGGTAAGGGKHLELFCCSHPQRNLPRQTRTRSDASAMQNSCQVNQGEQHSPCLLCCGEPAELIAAFFPLSGTPIKRGMKACLMGKLLGNVVQGAQSSLSPFKSQGFPSLMQFKEGRTTSSRHWRPWIPLCLAGVVRGKLLAGAKLH